MFPRSFRAAALAAVLLLAFVNAHPAQGQVRRSRVTSTVDDTRRVELKGNTRPEANAANDLGPVPDAHPLEHMMLQLRRSPEQEQALAVLMDQLHTSGSPNYHKWLTAEEFGTRFGVSDADLAAVTGWLTTHGLKVNQVYANRMVIDFSGTAGEVRSAFKTEIHSVTVQGEQHFANMTDPQIPAALAPVVVGVASMHDFKPHMMHKPVQASHIDPKTGALISAAPASGVHSNYTYPNGAGNVYALVPEDLATIYNLKKLFQAGYSGQGQTVVVIEDTNVFSTADWTTFRSAFGLSVYMQGTFSQVHPGGCTDPGTLAGVESEAELDAEWASASAPNAAIVLASCQDAASFGGLIALQNLLNAGNPPNIISISYGECEPFNGATANATYNSTYQQAAAMGVSVFVSAGDEGAASCDANQIDASHGITVSAFASTAYNVAVGGTDYGDSYAGTNSTYWNPTNDASYGSAKSYINEIPWNDSCASQLLTTYIAGSGHVPYGSSGFCNSSTASNDGLITTASGSGGPSGCATGTPSTSGVVSGTCMGYSRPSWQAGVFGLPTDNSVRVLPDVSLFAANGVWGHYYVFCDSDVGDGGAVCTGAPSGWSGAGGTSFSAPILAGIQALVNQKTGSAQGNPNYVYYKLAANEYGASGSTTCNSSLGNGVATGCIFYDVTQGDMDVDCTTTNNCYRPSGTYGILSTSNGAPKPAFGTGTGWDYATGIGTVNAYNLVNNWNSAAAGIPTTTTISAIPTTIQQSASTTLTATVTGTHGISPTGTVSFYIGSSSGTLLGSPSLVQGAAPNSSAQLVVQGTSLVVGANSLVAVYNGDNADDAPSTSPTPATVTVQSSVQPQTISFTAPASVTYGVAPITLTATASSTLPVTLTLTSGPATLVGNTLTITGAGSVVVTATQPGGTVGSVTYSAATPVVQTIVVSKATLTVTATNLNIAYGSAIPTLTAGFTGFVNGDSASVVTGAPALATTATSSSPNGSYPITAGLGTLTAANYTFVFVAGTLTIQAPNALNFGTVNVGTTSTVLSYRYSFGSSVNVTSIAILTTGDTGLDFADGGSTTCTAGSYTSGQNCIITVHLTPSAPGVVAGSLVLYGAGNIPIASLPLAGVGSAPHVSFGFAPSSSLSASGLNGPSDVAIDSAGNVFIADTLNNRVVELPKGGGSLVVGSGLAYPVGVAVDGAGDLFIADTNFQLSEVPNENGTLNSAHQVSVNAGISAYYPLLLKFDSSGNLFIADTGSGKIIKVPSVGGALKPAAKTLLGVGLGGPSGVAIDSAGDVFVADAGGNQVIEIAPNGTQSVINVMAGGLALNAPSAVAVDAAGDLFITDTNNNRVVEVAANGTQSVLSVTGGLSGPGGIVQDSLGKLYIADFGHNQIVTLAANTTPALSFGSASVGATTLAQSLPVTNTGNAALNFSNLSLPTGFVSATVGGDCTTGSPVAAGATCNAGVAFAPKSAGSQNPSETLTDNNLNVGGSVQNISLTGTGVTFSGLSINWAALSYPNVLIDGERSGAWPVTVTNSSGSTVTGISINLSPGFSYDTSTCGASLAASTSCGFNVYFQPSTVGAITGSLTVSGDGIGSSVSIPVSGTAVAPFLHFNWSALNFPPPLTRIGSQSTPWPVTVTNYTAGTLAGISLALPANFQVTGTNTCTNPVPSRGACSFNVVFAPLANGSFTGNLTATSGNLSASIPVSGTAQPTSLIFNWGAVTFDQNQIVGTTSPAWPLLLVNESGQTVSGLVLHPPVGFTVGQDTCTGATLIVNGTCTFNVYFAPVSAGMQSANLTVTSTQGPAGTIPVSGPAIPQLLYINWAALNFSPPAIASGTQTSPWPVTVTNNTIATQTLSITIPAGFTADTSPCAAPLAVNASCTFNVVFHPTSPGIFTGLVTVMDGTHTSSITAYGAAF